MEAATPKLQPVRQPPQTEQTRTGYSVEVENWTQQTECSHVQVQGWRVWDVPMQCRHHDCRTPTAALSTAWCYEAGHVAWTNATEGQALWQPGGAEEDSRLREDNKHLHLAYDEGDNIFAKRQMHLLTLKTYICCKFQHFVLYHKCAGKQAWQMCGFFLHFVVDVFFKKKTNIFLLLNIWAQLTHLPLCAHIAFGMKVHLTREFL